MGLILVILMIQKSLKELSLQATSTNKTSKVQRNQTPSVPVKGYQPCNEEISDLLQPRPLLLWNPGDLILKQTVSDANRYFCI